MKLLRTVHAACALFAGVALALALFGVLRLALVLIALVLLLVAWSLELIRSSLPKPEPRR